MISCIGHPGKLFPLRPHPQPLSLQVTWRQRTRTFLSPGLGFHLLGSYPHARVTNAISRPAQGHLWSVRAHPHNPCPTCPWERPASRRAPTLRCFISLVSAGCHPAAAKTLILRTLGGRSPGGLTGLPLPRALPASLGDRWPSALLGPWKGYSSWPHLHRASPSLCPQGPKDTSHCF